MKTITVERREIGFTRSLSDLSVYFVLGKWRASVFFALSAASGYMVAATTLSGTLVWLVLGVFFLSCGAGGLNQYQEWDLDRTMARTRTRPIPSGRLTARQALCASALFICLGFGILGMTGGIAALGSGAIALALYNGLYTPLKRVSPYAILPGALTGTIPPLLGGITAGESGADYQTLALCLFFYLWQIPHFYLTLLTHWKDYRRAGLHSLDKVFTKGQLIRLVFVWIFSLTVSAILIVLRERTSHLLLFTMVGAGAWLLWGAAALLRHGEEHVAPMFLLRRMNHYMIVILVTLAAGRLAM